MNIHKFRDFSKRNPIHVKNPYLNEIIKKFSFHVITGNDLHELQIIEQKAYKSIIVIHENKIDEIEDTLFIICYNYSIIIIQSSNLFLLDSFFKNNSESPIYYLNKGIKKKIPNYQSNRSNFHKLTYPRYQNFITNFFDYFILEYDPEMKEFQLLFWKIVRNCISAFLIQNGFLNSLNDKIKNREKCFTQKTNEIEIKHDEYISLEFFKEGSISSIYIIYLIKNERICILKIFGKERDENFKIFEREHKNYLNLKHPFVPQYFGKEETNNTKSLFIEYFEGNTLNDLNMDIVSFQDKTKMLFDLMITIEYFHSNELIYRDLKPNNIIIDQNYNPFFIDFDRMITNKEQNNDDLNEEKTSFDKSIEYYSPELIEKRPVSNKTDIYSLGILISIFKFENEFIEYKNEIKKLHEIESNCTKYNENERPNIDEIINDFYNNFYLKIYKIFEIDDISKISKYHGKLFSQFWYLIAKSQNPEYQIKLALLYKNGFYIHHNTKNGFIEYCESNNFNKNEYYDEIQFIPQDLKKTKQYFTLAANQNHSEAQYYLGLIYLISNINESIHYFMLASNQNHTESQFFLGLIYFNGNEGIERDINKAIQYFTIAANKNHAESQYYLGVIYSKGTYIPLDIPKSIHYYTLAANQNHPNAGYDLGAMYYNGIYVEQDTKKSIYYYKISANQNYATAQFDLGLIYLSKNTRKSIQKSIYYFTLAANQNYEKALFILGTFYYIGKYVTQDIDKSIYYFTAASKLDHKESSDVLEIINSCIQKSITEQILLLFFDSANQDAEAQYKIGLLYYYGDKISFDIDKSLDYFLLAAQNNYPKALYAMGTIYYEPKYAKFDINSALFYFKLASENNISDAQYALGAIYIEGKYVDKDLNKAIYYFELAANQNHSNAQYELGDIYIEGKFVNKDLNKAIYYFELAANQNHSNAQFRLGELYYKGVLVKQDIIKSLKYLSLAASQNHSKALLKIGLIYLEGIFVQRNINKAIYYLTLAANQGDILAQNNLGIIYYDDIYIKPDINKSLHFFSLAAENKYPPSLNGLGAIYFNNKYIKRNIDKSIYYFEAAAKLNNIDSQYSIGILYYFGYYVTIDINKAIYYFTLAANQNHTESQYYLGLIYSNSKYLDINKAIFYYTLAANKNDRKSENNLAQLYFQGIYVERDVQKAIYYFTCAANHNLKESQFSLGLIYEEGKYMQQDINKSIYYYSLAAKQNHKDALYRLGVIYYYGLYNQKDINKGIQYFELSAKNKHTISRFFTGYFYHEGKYVKRDIEKALHYYKEASSFNEENSKNNLGILYKNGFGNEIEKNLGLAEIYFKEAIRIKKDYFFAIYNLAHLYLCEKEIKNGIDKSIQLLLTSETVDFLEKLLCIALVKKNGFNINLIKEEFKKENKNESADIICRKIINMNLNNFVVYEKFYEYYRNIDFISTPYGHFFSKDLLNINQCFSSSDNTKKENISSLFYEGFGLEI